MEKPIIFVCISYDTLWDDFDSIKIKEFASQLPYASAIKFIAKKINSVYYSFGDGEQQKNDLFELRLYIKDDDEALSRFDAFIANQAHPYLYSNESALRFYQLLLQCGDKINPERELTVSEIGKVLKIYLYCNKVWLDQQQDKMAGLDYTSLSIKVDLPYAEFKYHKDFKSALYKSRFFFDYCEQDKKLRPFIQQLLKERNVSSYSEYIIHLFLFYCDSIQSPIIKKQQDAFSSFFSIYVVENTSCSKIWDDGLKGLSYLRDHFLLETSDGKYVLLNPGMLIDKMYQGVIFDLWKVIEEHQDSQNPTFKSFPDYKSYLGDDFSEHYLFYDVIRHCFDYSDLVCFSGEELKNRRVKAEPDFYIRKDNFIFLFEYKDLIFPDRDKYSNDINIIKATIFDRICKDDGIKKRKGGGQLLETIDHIVNSHSMDNIDRPHEDTDLFFPIIVTTDKVFDALGVNAIVVGEFVRLYKVYHAGLKSHVGAPIIINLDNLIDLMYRLHMGALKLSDLLKDYSSQFTKKDISLHQRSFDTYIRELDKNHLISEAENHYLFKDLLSKFNNELGIGENSK